MRYPESVAAGGREAGWQGEEWPDVEDYARPAPPPRQPPPKPRYNEWEAVKAEINRRRAQEWRPRDV